MKIFTLSELEELNLIQLGRGKVISKNDLKNNPGTYPVYSSAKNRDGVFGTWSNFDFNEEMITWSVDGGGDLFYRSKHKFSVTNVGGFIRVTDKNKILTKYLFYALKNLHNTVDFDWVKKAHPSVLRKEYNYIPVPSLQEQKIIVERLDKVFENIDATLSNNALKKKLYNDYFESISSDEVFENQKFAKNPISDFFELDPSKSEISNENLDEVSFIPMADVDELIFEVDSKQIKDYKQVKKGYKYFANGDFLLAKITPCFENGKMGQVNNLKNKIGFGSTEFIVHRSNGKILNEWLYLIYSNSRIRKKLATTMSGAVGHKRVSKETISNLQISSPTIEEQKKIIDKLFIIKKNIDKKLSVIDQEIVKYSLLKKSIIKKEFSYE